MKLKTYFLSDDSANNNNTINCVDWANNVEVYYIKNNQIFKSNSYTRETVELAKLPENFIATDFHWYNSRSSGSQSGGSTGSNEALLISSNDGRFIILNKGIRMEKNISAHSMAIVSGRWSTDGAGLFTASEDGVIKIWSRSGMLRSTVVQSTEPIISACWSPNSTAIAFCQGGSIAIKPLAANSKISKWKAHEGLVLCIAWSVENNIIVSSGEDHKYKIWDAQGANIFTSSAEEFSITSLAFCPVKNLIAVGGFNNLKLCDLSGWVYENKTFNDEKVGSVQSISWSPDGTQVSSGNSVGQLLFGYVIERQLVSRNFIATTTGRKSILLKDITNETSEVLEFPDRIINFELAYGHLVVATSKQIHIFNEKSINTPIIIDGRNETRHIEIGKKYFLVMDSSSIWVYTFSGRLLLNPRFPGSQAQIPQMSRHHISLGLDTLAVRDVQELRTIYIFNLLPSASMQYESTTISCKSSISSIFACKAGSSDDQYLAIIDCNKEFFITSTKSGSESNEIYKIGTEVIDAIWGNETNILVGLQDNSYSVWYCPGESAADPTLIALTTVSLDISEFGKNISIYSFEDTVITFCCTGSLFSVSINMYCEALHRALNDNKWKHALKICRLAQNRILWGTLAAIATKRNQLDISEEAFCAAFQVDKINYLHYLKGLDNSSPEKMSENSLMFGRFAEAEKILIHNEKYDKAIQLSMRSHNWKRAIEIAEKYNIDVEPILTKRSLYLTDLGKLETEPVFLKYKD
ncbi:IFT80 family protein [Megaselia abdita]